MQRRHSRFQVSVIVLGLFCGAALPTAAAAPLRAFETDASPAATTSAKRDPAVARERHVRMQTGFAERLGRTEHRAVLNLFEGAEHVFNATRSRVSRDGVTTAEGELEGIPGSFACVSTLNGVSSMLVSIPGGGLFEVEHAGGDRYRVVEVDRAQMGQCGLTGAVHTEHQAQRRATKPAGGSAPRTAPASPPTAAAKGGGNISGCATNIYTLVDVLVAYTHPAFTNTTGTNAMFTRIEDGAAYCNAAFRNSGINLQVRVVGKVALPTNYVESGNLSTELTRAFNPGDGFMDELHGWRDGAGADLVCVMAERSDTSTIGIAYLLDSLSVAGNEAYGFSVVQRGFFSVTMAHELGHNFGCAHDRQNSSGNGLFSYSYGWKITNSPSISKTIMCYDPGTTIQYFSNPDILFNGLPTGQPIGSPTEAHNASTINQSAPIVAQYRLPTVSTYAPCLALLTPANNSTFGRNTLVTFTAEAGDDDGAIAMVEFFFASTNIGTVLGPGSNGFYSINFTMPNVNGPVPATFSVRATDNLGVTTSTQIVSLINIIPPANDKFTNAFTVSGNNAAILGNNIDATKEFGTINEPMHAGNNGAKSVWWKWSSPVAGSTTVNTTNRDFQPVLAIYTGTNVTNLAVVTSNINGGPVNFSAQSNVTYRIAVDGFRTGSVTEQGNFTLTLVGPPLPSNAPPPSFTNTTAYVSNNAFNFLVVGSPGQSFVLQISTNLSNWFDYSTNPLPGSNLLLMDNLLTNVPHRFYRLRLP